MKKSLLSILGLAVALAFSIPVLGNAAATTAAATTTTTTTAAPMKAAPKKVAAKKTVKKACKATKKHKCPVKTHKAAKKTAPKKAY